MGAGSKHGTNNSDLPDSVRWGLGESLVLPLAEEGYDDVVLILDGTAGGGSR